MKIDPDEFIRMFENFDTYYKNKNRFFEELYQQEQKKTEIQDAIISELRNQIKIGE